MLKYVSATLAAVALASACKQEQAPPPAATAAPSNPTSPTAISPVFQQPTPVVQQPLCDATVKECAPDPKVVELCQQEQSADPSVCENGIEKSLYESLKAKVDEAAAGAETTTAACTSTRYVNTQTDPLNVRNQASTAGIIIGTVVRGGELCVIGQISASDGLWYKLNLQNKVGYAYGAFTSTTRPATTTASTSGTSGGTTTSGTTTSTAECTLPCPTGFKCSKTQNWRLQTPDYFDRASEQNSTRMGRVQGGDSICTTGNIQTVQYWGGAYTMVRIKVRASTGFSPDYWMNCKYLSSASKTRIGCQ